MVDLLDEVLLAVAAVTDQEIESLSAERLIEDLRLDSLDEVEILMSLEEKLDVALDQTQVNSCRTLGDLAMLISKCVKL